jgi:hypothetical protein
MAKGIINTNLTHPGVRLYTDSDPSMQPKDTHRFALNAVTETVDGKQNLISNERANELVESLPTGYYPIGDKYIGDDTTVIIAVNPTVNRELIGLFLKDQTFKIVVDTAALGLKITNQCDIVFRLRRGGERVIYWVDGLNRARTFNFDRVQYFYTRAFSEYLRLGGNPDAYLLEKWDTSSFNLQKTYSTIPFFSNVQIIETGNILPGSYNAAISYCDEDLNPTEWINTTNTVNIYNDNSNNPYEKIRGSRNITSDSQSFPRASKSIKFTLTNLDVNFPYYRIAIIHGNDNSGVANKALVSELIPTSDSVYTYTGNDTHLTEVSLAEILIDQEVIFAPQHIEQQHNRLTLWNGKGKDINWCELQKYASKIFADLTTKDVVLNTISSEGNVKNAKHTFQFHGFLPGEVYAFNIHYIFPDFISPGFHIPGKSTTDKLSKMKVYELENRYLNIHNCSTNNYWGTDCNGDTLLGKPQRHHRFPFRKDVGSDLVNRVTSTINLNKYRLRATITLNPAWTPGPIAYPEDGGGDPVIIPYTFNYQIDGSPTVQSYNGNLIDSDIGEVITIYDDTLPLSQIDAPAYGELSVGSTLYTGYQNGGVNPRFLINFSYTSYVADSSINNDTSQLFGIEFSNIEKPHPDCIGFYITRAERLDDDKLIIDNAIIGTLTEFEQYRSFGLINPKQYYTVQDHLGNSFDSSKNVEYCKNAVWFFNPEFQYFQKKIEFDAIEIEGVYTESTKNMPTISNREGSPFNHGVSKGVYIDDVQAGTSYNPEAHKKKDKDDDGFDLIIGYRNLNFNYISDKTKVMPTKERVFYLNAAAYQNFDGFTYYNTSVDNKIGIYTFDSEIDTAWFYNAGTGKNQLLYGSLVKNNVNAYSNFLTRPFYKIHNNPIMFGDKVKVDNVEIFGGDVSTSATNIVSSTFYDMVVAERKKKSKLWKIVLGAVLIVAGVVVGVVTGGAGLGLSAIGAALLGGLAISYGVSLAVSGIKFEQFKKMIDTDYEKGLKETVSDGGTFECIRDTISRDDDTIRWFADRASNIYMESAVPFGLRSGLTCGVTDFIDAPNEYDEEEFRAYLTEKLTVIDRDQGSGRLYKGYATAEVYDMNKDYLRMNKEKAFQHLPIEYDCCADTAEKFPTRGWYSEQSFQEEKTDNYRVFLPNNYRDIEGEHGEITDVYKMGSELYIHTKEALYKLPTNYQERVNSELITFIGTGEFFAIPPIKVTVDDDLGSGGNQHKWANIKTEHGVVFVNEVEGKIYMHSDKLRDISEGNRNLFEETIKDTFSKQFFENLGLEYPFKNNPANPFGTGYLATYDPRHKRIIITKKDYRYLGNFSELILNFDPAREYQVNQIIVDEKGFNKITGISFDPYIQVDTATGWTEVTSVLSKPVLDYPNATEQAPQPMNFGVVYMKNGEIIYVSDEGTPVGSQELIPVKMRSCQVEYIQINITV